MAYAYRYNEDGPYCAVTRDWNCTSRRMRAADPADTRPGAHWDTSQKERKLKVLYEQNPDKSPVREFGGESNIQ